MNTRMPTIGRAWLLAGLCLLAAPAWSHKASDAYLHWQVLPGAAGEVDERLDIALRDLDRELDLDADGNGSLTWGEVRRRWPDIQALAGTAVQLSADGQPCRVQDHGQPQLDEHSDGRHAVLRRRWTCAAPPQQLQGRYTLFAQTDPQHRGIVRVDWAEAAGRDGPGPRTAVFVPGPDLQRFDVPAAARSSGADGPGWTGFVAQGVHHILIGADHVLFLLALLLPAVLVWRPAGLVLHTGRPAAGWTASQDRRGMALDLLKVVSAFTVAHSITLSLAAFDVVSPPSRWTESLIAASVVLVALNNLRPLVAAHRWPLTFVFGLVHGFGFAAVLKDLGLQREGLIAPLLGFNLGVELGQLAIVALLLPLAWRWRASALYRRGALQAGSLLIAALAGVWLVERAFDVALLAV
ncbi:HupE/UreJ family protein [Leptothrix discophora]|uniref:HupE/UreJ family protein n=1 Tax=Leptothrix discophora TaxID=89 RepID=A0ABT9G3P5_LEPDI|nr:HupE/UreJ family protein [Leptothrix discophora]MDP4301101.1 HupE/UreJ family protein [Leptothrix discophora]